MRPPVLLLLSCIACVVAPALARGAENDDLAFVPVATEPAAPAGPPPSSAKSAIAAVSAYIEDALSVSSAPRATVIPSISPPADWLHRTSFDLALTVRPAPAWTATLSDRLNVLLEDGQSVLSAQTVRNDLREAYVTWEPTARVYLEAGRINVRNGVALGDNPTDTFRARSLVAQPSFDPSVLRKNRLGTLMGRFQALWNGGAASVAYAPRLTSPTAIGETDRVGFDPKFDATNASHRILSTLAFDLSDLNPELLASFERDRSKVGVNISHPFGDAVIAYAEYAGGLEQNLLARSVAYGVETGTLPAYAAALFPTDTRKLFRNDLAVGASLTLGATVTINAEYHFHESGLSPADFRRAFATADALKSTPSIAAALLYPRGYAADQQEPATRHQAFVRIDWPRAFVRDLELTALAFVNLSDGSTLASATGTYNLSRRLSVSLFGAVNAGGPRTERGSLPQALSGTAVVSLYF